MSERANNKIDQPEISVVRTESYNDPLTSNSDLNTKAKEWVKFDEEEAFKNVSLESDNVEIQNGPAVLDTESVHVTVSDKVSRKITPETVNVKQDITRTKTSQPSVINVPSTMSSTMRTIELPAGRIHEGFANGDIIVTLLPVNVNWPWITPAVFRPELVPEELMAQGLTLTVEEYVQAMETLVNDYRFTLYNICYKRVLVCWILLAFGVLLGLLFSGITGILLFSLGVSWLFLNAVAIFICMWIKLRIARGLEKCLASVNKQLLRHKIILALDDRGNISCHKVNLCFIYFDASQCISYINNFLERNEQSGTPIQAGWETRLDVDTNDIIIQGSTMTRISRKQNFGELLLLRYMQRFGKDFLRHRLDWYMDERGLNATPRHLRSSYCPCQYTEEVLLRKTPKLPSEESTVSCSSCTTINQQMAKYGIPCGCCGNIGGVFTDVQHIYYY